MIDGEARRLRSQFINRRYSMRQNRTFKIAVWAVELALIGIGQQFIVQDIVTFRTKNAIGIIMGHLFTIFLVCKTKILHRIFQLHARENWQIPIGYDGRFRRLCRTIQHHLISGIDFTISIHLISEQIGKNDDLRLNILCHMLKRGLVYFQHRIFGAGFLAWRSQEAGNNPLQQVGTSRIRKDGAIFFLKDLCNKRRG